MGKVLKFITFQVVFLILLSTFAFAQQFAPNNQALKEIQQKNPSLSLSGQEYNTDLFTGSASYSYEIEAPDGVNGLKPQISLNYNHHSSSADGPVGMGWIRGVV